MTWRLNVHGVPLHVGDVLARDAAQEGAQLRLRQRTILPVDPQGVAGTHARLDAPVPVRAEDIHGVRRVFVRHQIEPLR